MFVTNLFTDVTLEMFVTTLFTDVALEITLLLYSQM